MTAVISIKNLNKTYANGFTALQDVSLDIKAGEILALLGPNGAGKTTLISTVCGIVQKTSGQITVQGYDHIADYRAARKCIGLVPQELATDPFDTPWKVVRFSRGLFGKPANDAYLEDLLKRLSLWDKKDQQVRALSGGMKRRLLIAKALSHEPEILFLDEPTAGVDVELRKSMWQYVQELKARGVTIILTTHYIEEAEAIADRIGVINKGQIILVENTASLMKKLGRKELRLELQTPLSRIPADMAAFNLHLSEDGMQITYTYNRATEGDGTGDNGARDDGIVALLEHMRAHNLSFKELHTRQSSLEDIFVELVGKP